MVPPLSGSVSASLRSAFLLPFSSSAAATAGGRVPINSSSSSRLRLLPSGRPPAPSQTKTQTLRSWRWSHFRRPAPTPPPRRYTQRDTPLRHFRRRQAARTTALSDPALPGLGGGVGWGVCHVTPWSGPGEIRDLSPPPPPPPRRASPPSPAPLLSGRGSLGSGPGGRVRKLPRCPALGEDPKPVCLLRSAFVGRRYAL